MTAGIVVNPPTPAEALASDMSPTAIGGRAEAPDPAPAVPGDDPAGPDAAAPESPDPPPALDLPATARVMIHVPVRPSAAGRQAIEAMAEAGIALPETRGVPFTIAMSQVRFYHAADEAAARVLAEAADLALRDFTDYRPLPDTGLIEVWIAGSAPDWQDTTASRFDPDRAANGVARALRDLFRNFPAHEGR